MRPIVMVAIAVTATSVGLGALMHGERDENREPSSRAAAQSGTRPHAERTPALELRWTPAGSAVLYNVILWRDGERVLDLWPQGDKVTIPRGKLEPGEYQWFVYPMLGDGSGRHYGELVDQGTIRISRASSSPSGGDPPA